MQNVRYLIVDTETTGLKWEKGDRIFNIAAIEIIDRKVVNEIEFLVNPNVKINKDIEKICKITQKDLEDKPEFKDILPKIVEFINKDLDNTVLVAHNIKFDIGFINNEFKLCEHETLQHKRQIDTLKMAKFFHPGEQTSLDKLCTKYNIDLKERGDKGHSALLDTKLLAEVFLNMTEGMTDDEIINFDKNDIEFEGFIKQDKPVQSIILKRAPEEEIKIQDEIIAHQKMLQKIKSKKEW